MSGKAHVFGIGIALLVSAGCSRKKWEDRAVDHSLVRVEADKLVLRTDTIGEGKWARPVTFVLVDAYNTHDTDLVVDLGGHLVDASGARVAPLRADSLRIPAKGQRTFALVDKANRARPEATGATVEVLSARTVDHAPPIVVSNGHVYLDQGRVVTTGYVVNTHPERGAKVVVLSAFYDGAGRPVRRPFDVLLVGPGRKKAVRFVGPKGTRKGYIFIGQVLYP